MIDVGTQRQLFLDDLFFDEQYRVELVAHQPTRREVSVESDRSWESGGVHYSSVVQDGDRFKMWYRADTGGDPNSAIDSESWVCYAESADGIVWEKPNLGIVSSVENGNNNILFPDKASGINPCVIIDPSASENQRYKMIARGSGPACVLGYTSSNGISWEPLSENPLLSEPGPFDSHNVLVYDNEANRYVIFCRGIDTTEKAQKRLRSYMGKKDGIGTLDFFKDGIRAIRRTESPDFHTWSDMELVLTADDADPADLHLYTNAAFRYTRAQRAWMMFPMTLYVDREGTANSYPGLSDVQFVVSRDGVTWDRRFRRPFLSPERDERDWVDRNPIIGIGMLQTAPDELSLYYSELLRCEDCRFSRCTIRTDGFVSARGPYDGWGEFTTPPLQSAGSRLALNYRTTGGGIMDVALLDAQGTDLPGFSFEDCDTLFGNHIDATVTWNGQDRFSFPPKSTVRLRVRLRDADLFAFQFLD